MAPGSPFSIDQSDDRLDPRSVSTPAIAIPRGSIGITPSSSSDSATSDLASASGELVTDDRRRQYSEEELLELLDFQRTKITRLEALVSSTQAIAQFSSALRPSGNSPEVTYTIYADESK